MKPSHIKINSFPSIVMNIYLSKETFDSVRQRYFSKLFQLFLDFFKIDKTVIICFSFF